MPRTGPEFSTIRTEGVMLPSDILRRIAAGEVEGVRAADYGLPGAMKLNEAISSAWSRARDHWADFTAAREALGDHDETATVTTRQKWLQPLLEILGFGRLSPGKGQEIEGKAYPIQFLWQQVPMHLLGCRVPIDRRSRGVAGAATGSPHSLVQEFLNRSPEHLWAIVSNGLQWRLLRDNHTLSRQAYVEFDLEAMMQGEVYSDFALFWTLCHASCFEGEKPESCRLESWSRLAVTDGVKILGGLRDSVTKAIESLGQGFVGHPDNHDLRERLRDGRLSTQELYREVLRQIYRLLFLFVAEDRDLLHPPETSPEIRALYDRHYSTRRLREMADRVRGTAHGDLWHGLSLVLHRLGDPAGCPELGLPSLGSFLWDPASTAHLNAPSTPTPAGSPAHCHAAIDNEHLLSAIRSLAYAEVGGVRRIVDYRNLGAEELGSVYESLLELVPTVVAETTAERSRFDLRTAAGNERKKSGSYYTPDSLVQCLLDSALEPVVADRVRNCKTPAERAEAVLSITVCDPAVGSGHFVIAAAHRLARHLARHRTGDSEPAPEDYRSALREVIRTSIYGIDINPMAAELCRVALWIESMEPGKPLSFLEHHIRVGNSLVGVTPELLAKGLPDDAFKAIEGDDSKVVSALKKRNKQERDGKQAMFDFGAPPAADLAKQFSTLASGSDDTIAAVSRRRRQYEGLLASDDYRNALLAADAWCAAFFWRKDGSKIGGIEGLTHELLREIEQHPERFPPGNAIRDEIDRLAAENQFLHLHLAYPEIATRGGFDCVLGNPPWERVSVEDIPYFSSIDPAIAAAQTTPMRKSLIKQLASEQPLMFAEFQHKKVSAVRLGGYIKHSGRYPNSAAGRLDLYPLFVECAMCMVATHGQIGVVVPTGVATSVPLGRLWNSLFHAKRLVQLADFDNTAGYFPDVDSRKKFCLLTAAGEPCTDRVVRFGFFLPRADSASIAEHSFPLSLEDLLRVNPATGQPPVVPSTLDLALLVRVHRRSSRNGDVSPGWVGYTSAGTGGSWLPCDGTAIDVARFTPLVEGKLVHQFTHRYATYECCSSEAVAKGQPRVFEEAARPDVRTRPRFAVPRESTREFLRRKSSLPYCVGCYRDYTSATNERTLIAAIIADGVPMQPLNGFSAHSAADATSAVCRLNSFVIDYVARLKTPDIHLNVTIFDQLPGEAACDCCVHKHVQARGLELSVTSDDMAPFSRDLWPEGDGAVFRWDPDRRFEIRCELDAIFFHLYLGSEDEWRRTASPELLAALPTPRHAIEYIMETFPGVKDGDIDVHGRYRTKERILVLYDRLQECLARGTAFTSELDPPPGPPTNPDGTFRRLPAWPPGTPRPADYPIHLHPPIEHRSSRKGEVR